MPWWNKSGGSDAADDDNGEAAQGCTHPQTATYEMSIITWYDNEGKAHGITIVGEYCLKCNAVLKETPTNY